MTHARVMTSTMSGLQALSAPLPALPPAAPTPFVPASIRRVPQPKTPIDSEGESQKPLHSAPDRAEARPSTFQMMMVAARDRRLVMASGAEPRAAA
jgi:hypothetical protein